MCKINNENLIYFLSHPIQYFSPLLKKLNEKTSLEVAYFSDVSVTEYLDSGFGSKVKWDTPLLEGYKYKFLKNWQRRKPLTNKFWDVFNPGVVIALWKTKQKIIVVNGWAYSTNWLIFIFGKLLGKEIWLRAESPLSQELLKDKRLIILKVFFFKQILFKYFIAKFLYIGEQNKQFYKFYGIKKDEQLIFAPYSVDNDYFQEQFESKKHLEKCIKDKAGIPENSKVILFSGKFIAKKRPLDLLIAFSALSNHRNYFLVFMGEGELRKDMEAFILAKDIKNVLLTGFINQTRVSDFYSVADVFVMCSGVGETWGLSVNEAMNFSLPVIVSRTCGCSSDLVVDGGNGFVFEEGDIEMLARHLSTILENDELAEKMGKKSSDIISNYSISTITRNILAAL